MRWIMKAWRNVFKGYLQVLTVDVCSIIPYLVESYFVFNKKCCIYAACGVLQTPTIIDSPK